MHKISSKFYKENTSYLQDKKDANFRVHFLEQAVCVVAENGNCVFIHDTEQGRFFQETAQTIIGLYHSLRDLYLKQITVQRFSFGEAGSIPVDKLVFTYEPITFDFTAIRELAFAVEKARYISRK